jgi:hypothetical protein
MNEYDAPESNCMIVVLELTRKVPRTTSGASWASSIATILILPLAKFCLAVIGAELALRFGIEFATGV